MYLIVFECPSWAGDWFPIHVEQSEMGSSLDLESFAFVLTRVETQGLDPDLRCLMRLHGIPHAAGCSHCTPQCAGNSMYKRNSKGRGYNVNTV